MTSIEWLFENLWDEPKDKLTWHSIFEKAKEMHKQEMKEMYLKGIENYDPTFKRKDDTFKVWECCGMEECICGSDDHIVDTNKMVDQVPDVRKMKRSAVTFLIEQIEGRGYFSNEFPLKRKTIEHIIKRALEIEQEIQETLYTEEQAIEFAKWLAENWFPMWVKDKFVWEHDWDKTCEEQKYQGYYNEKELFNLFLSLKQPKKD
jgi:hypothetical protein